MPVLANPNRDRMKSFELYLLPCKLSELIVFPIRSVPMEGRSHSGCLPGECLIISYAPKAIAEYKLTEMSWNLARWTPAFADIYENVMRMDPNDSQWGISSIELYDTEKGIGAVVTSRNCIASRCLCTLIPEDTP